MYKIIHVIFIIAFVLLGVMSCSSIESTPPLPTEIEAIPPLPTDPFSHSDRFGDGYIPKVKVVDTKGASSGKIIYDLVTQWLEHYKTQSGYQDAALDDFHIDAVHILDNRSIYTYYVIVADVNFSIIPKKVPNDYAGFPGDSYTPKTPWWHIAAPFGVIQVGEYYYLTLVFGWGT